MGPKDFPLMEDHPSLNLEWNKG